MCDCKQFCDRHGRDQIAVAPDGSEYCGECAADGWGGELCETSHESCDMLQPLANKWERQFMCAEHAAEHVTFCEEAIAAITYLSRHK